MISPYLDNCSRSPKDHKELFNLRHSQLRNVVERIFGAAKKKFKMLRELLHYPIETQIRIQPAIGLIINFIRIHDPDDIPDPEPNEDGEEEEELSEDCLAEDGIRGAESTRAVGLRERIALAMWDSYQIELARRGIA
jgi:hypothetical protein